MSRASINFGQSVGNLINSLSFSNISHHEHINSTSHHNDNTTNLTQDLPDNSFNQSNQHDTSSENIENIEAEKEKNKINSNSGSNVNINNNYNPSEQAILSAIYNTLAISVFVICLSLCALLLIVLQAFVRSILWALLTSAFLFSFKRYLTESSLKKLNHIEKTGSTLAFESILLPIKLIDSSVDYAWSFFSSKYRNLIAIGLLIILFHLASSFYQSFFDYSILFFSVANKFSNLMTYYVDNSWQFTLTLSLSYLIAISFYWNDADYKTQLIFKILSYSIWLSLFFLSSKLMGAYRPFFTMIFMFLICLGLYSFVNETFTFYKRSSNSNKRKNQTNEESSVEDLVAEENKLLNNDSIASSMHSTNIETEKSQNKDESVEVEDEENASDDTIIDETNNNSTLNNSSNSSFIRTTLYNIYQTSFYYLNNNNKKEEQKKNEFYHFLRNKNRKRETSDKYFYSLFWLFICIKLRYDLYIMIPVLVLIWKLMKYLFKIVISFVLNNKNTIYYFDKTKFWIEKRKNVLLPQPFHIIFKLFIKGDLKVNQLLQKSIDNLITLLMIIFLSLFVLITVIVLAMQVHSESIELITIGSNIINENVYGNSELKEWLPEKEKLNELYQASMNNFYLYGREWLTKTLKSSTTNSDQSSSLSNKSDYLQLEAQLLKQWDSLYSYLSSKAIYGTKNNYSKKATEVSPITSEELPPLSVPDKSELKQKSIGTQTPNFDENAMKQSPWTNLIFSSNRSLDLQNVVLIVKDNFSILVSILDSLYLIIKGNVNLLSTILYTVISIIFSSGFALMNFFFSFIVYLTALFYLLSMSGSRYKPFQWLTEISKNNVVSEKNSNSKSDLLISAIEDSITSVFVVSLKMALFFGIYTYLVNCLFSVSIVYLTSIFAALLAFLPLVGTYWCSVFGVLELWLIHHKPLNAVLFFFVNILPYIISVDRAIYSEIKVGHPYLSSLAFAGGVYCLGLEGAIIGPIVLCLCIVIFKMIANTNAPSATLNVKKSKSNYLFKTPSIDKTNI